MGDSPSLSAANKDRIVTALRNHQINTTADLRRVERVFARMGTSDIAEPMTAAWQYHANSNALLAEIRALTQHYPFSSDCLSEAKRRVYADPASNRSWNLCWLILQKIKSDSLVPYYAGYQAAMPTMWGGRTPSQQEIQQLATAFATEWSWAVEEMLRHWEEPPCSE